MDEWEDDFRCLEIILTLTFSPCFSGLQLMFSSLESQNNKHVQLLQDRILGQSINLLQFPSS